MNGDMIILNFDIPGHPKERPRFSKHGTHTYTPKKTVAYENYIRVNARKQMNGVKPLEDLIYVTFDFCFKKPKKTKLLTPKKDLDNLIKSTSDAMNKVCYLDDTQIVNIVASKRWGDKDFVRVIFGESMRWL